MFRFVRRLVVAVIVVLLAAVPLGVPAHAEQPSGLADRVNSNPGVYSMAAGEAYERQSQLYEDLLSNEYERAGYDRTGMTPRNEATVRQWAGQRMPNESNGDWRRRAEMNMRDHTNTSARRTAASVWNHAASSGRVPGGTIPNPGTLSDLVAQSRGEVVPVNPRPAATSSVLGAGAGVQGSGTDVVPVDRQQRAEQVSNNSRQRGGIPWGAAGRAVGGATGVGSAYFLGAGLTAGAMDMTAEWFGWDPEGAVCGGTDNQVVHMLAGRSCAGWGEESLQELTPTSWQAAEQGGWGVRPAGVSSGHNNAWEEGRQCFEIFGPRSRVRESSGQIPTSLYSSSGLTSSYSIFEDCGHAYGPLDSSGGLIHAGYQTGDVRPWIRVEIDGRTVTLEAEEVNEGDVGALELETVVRDAVGNEIRSQYDGDRALPGMPAVTEDFGVPHSVEVVHPDSGETVLEQETSPEFRGFAESHPECLDGTCSLELMEAQEDGGLGLVSAERGRDWTERVESFDDYATTDGLVCVYGGELLQLSECRALAHDYNAEHQNAGTVNVDPESGEWSGDYNSPSSSGLAEADRQAEADRDFEEARERESEAMNEDAEDRQDEAMNAQQGQPGQLEGPQAFTNPLGAHLPQQGTATGTSPAWAQPTTMEAPGAAPDPEGERGCEWGEISWNPVSWVLVPVQCALAWAFVPSSASTEVSVGQGLSSWNNNIIGSTIGLGFGIDGVLTPFNRDAGGCSMSLDLDFGLASVPIGLDFCDGWGERLRELTRLASVLIASVFSFCETRRRLASMVNYNAGQC